jgi:phosphonate ABC transporter substrate-binding protein
MVLEGRVDASANDSIVLELELKRDPELAPELRIIETLGPTPIPPAVISTGVPAATRQRLRAALLRMHEADEGRRVLEAGMAARFVAMADGAYDEIRAMAIQAEPVRLSPTGGEANFLFRSHHDGRFREHGLAAGMTLPEGGWARSGMGIDAAPPHPNGG